jgi:glycine cleavage system H protein
VKAASDVYTPVSGAVVEFNATLEDKPELVNEDAEGAGWFFKIKIADASELGDLMDRDTYLAYAREEG